MVGGGGGGGGGSGGAGGGMAARAFGRPRLCTRVVIFSLEGHETMAGAYSIQGSGASGARFWTSAVLRESHFWPPGARSRGGRT